jgi:hypothetical protein
MPYQRARFATLQFATRSGLLLSICCKTLQFATRFAGIAGRICGRTADSRRLLVALFLLSSLSPPSLESPTHILEQEPPYAIVKKV